jgi:hypothetical protein
VVSGCRTDGPRLRGSAELGPRIRTGGDEGPGGRPVLGSGCDDCARFSLTGTLDSES